MPSYCWINCGIVDEIVGNGSVEFNEFIVMMSCRMQQQSLINDEMRRQQREEDEVRQAFRIFDIDGDGLIDAQELRLTMQNLGENLSDDDVRAMIKSADKNGDGKIDYEGLYHRHSVSSYSYFSSSSSSSLSSLLFYSSTISSHMTSRVNPFNTLHVTVL